MSYKKIALLAGLVFVVGSTYYLYSDFQEVEEKSDQINSMSPNMRPDGSSKGNSKGTEGKNETNS